MFKDRQYAGHKLGEKLFDRFPDLSASLVLAIPRGGVVVGHVIAGMLKTPLNIVYVKKLAAPGNSELAIGAVVDDGTSYLDKLFIGMNNISHNYIDEEIKKKKTELERRKLNYSSAPIPGGVKQVIITDDGIATGATIFAAILSVKKRMPNVRIVVAVPVVTKEVYDKLKLKANDVAALEVVEKFSSVAQFYEEFEQVTDDAVLKILKKHQ